MDEIAVYVETRIALTESEHKVKQAVENMFGPMEMEVKPLGKGSLLLAACAKDSDAFIRFRNLLQRERIRSAARTVLFEGLEKRSINFCLNKQVAFAGHISFSKEVAESPLGPIKVRIECDNPRQAINMLTATK